MLVLTRKLKESIQIGDDIEIKIVAIDGDQIKIGIDAPKHVDIHRKEVYLAIQEENSEAANTTVDALQQLLQGSDPFKGQNR
ncbi:carbon storage regulator CsrA [Desertibacillus haloalkaliphilus]|uniref:carbon storage regulator CsrA n=1 Tax=Desertibacillus haloalkaliphilus TaxID=1328930 RepID=UPI001C26B316|nr:carbon storage regulator CsrA [Desertibacillus haloalkaliphilus]MBU8905990.1 carbon storage regulator CsrA [Desertibacillus haloalkaliphilus]